MDSSNKIIETIKTVLFYIICWTTGIIFLRIGAINISLDQPDKIHIVFCLFLVAGLLLLLLPFFKKVKFGVVELEREIAQTKKEVSEFKTDVRQQLTVLSTNINTIGNLSNHVNLYLPGSQEIKEEITTIKEKQGDKKKEVSEVADELMLPHEDRMMALARTRIRLEFLLRSILEKRRTTSNADKPIKYLSLGQLTKEFTQLYPEYEYLGRSLDFVTRICNASIHAQIIDPRQGDEALQLGANIIVTLNSIYAKQ